MLYASFACRLTLVAVMALAAVAKLRSPGAFAASLGEFGFVPARLRRPLAVLVPAAELLVALLLAVPATVTAGFVAAALLCCGLTAVPVAVVVRGKRVACACFGSGGAPMGGWHIARNAVLLAAACLGAAVALSQGGGVPGRIPGIALAVFSAGLLTTLTVFVDDIAALFRSPVAAGGPGR
ncbi:methylamine utilization protein MauE [Actinomadura sp. LD22]|uniref:Methylamine utilization protein MauE n=1 Tax=Actinomadura physcomitrii TaxID=2650748 RepID=A0A6I4MNJ8_9ACTN|nr:MauE/DoxX family redox-associated membrane protein [Actinomadura physcomitrii]MWA04359.1 methylamine utilization protein MauE [Actinomadura physcomitrii]